MSYLSENIGQDVLRGDVILPQTGSDESPAVLDKSVVVVDSECRDTVRGTLEGERMCKVDPQLVSELSCEPVRSVAGKLVRGQIRFSDHRAEKHSFMFGEGLLPLICALRG